MRKLFLICIIPGFAFANGASKPPPSTVKEVVLTSYAGLWHEVARIPNSFQDNHKKKFGECRSTTAEYTLLPTGKVEVLNTCHRFDPDGNEFVEEAQAIGRVVRDSGNAKLKVNFTGIDFLRKLGIGDGDYWILDLGPLNDQGLYSWVLVGAPKRDFGWILAREHSLDDVLIDQILDKAYEQGYSKEQFQRF